MIIKEDSRCISVFVISTLILDLTQNLIDFFVIIGTIELLSDFGLFDFPLKDGLLVVFIFLFMEVLFGLSNRYLVNSVHKVLLFQLLLLSLFQHGISEIIALLFSLTVVLFLERFAENV